MPIERVLIEYAKVQLQLLVANETITQLQEQIKQLTPAANVPTQA